MSERILMSILAAVLATSPARARDASWAPIGPPGGAVRTLAIDPSGPHRIYLGTGDGMLYRSDDGGSTWQRTTPGFPRRGCSLDEIVVDDRGIVYVGYWDVHGSGGGVATSADHGQSFTLSPALSNESVRALAVAASDRRQIVAGTLSGAFLSRDGAKTWTRITPEGDSLRNLASVAIDPEDARVIYLGTRHLAWKSADGGATWVPIHTGMIEDSHVMTLSIDRRDPQILYATACTGVYRSTDGGGEWMKMDGIPDSSRRTPAFLQGRDGLLLAGTTQGLWMSEDAGRRWQCVTPKNLSINALVIPPDGSIVLGTESGVMLSTDRGRTWSASNTGFTEQLVSRVLFDATGRMWVVTWGPSGRGGVFTSTDLPHWSRLADGLEGRQITSLAQLEHAVLCGTDRGIFTWDATANTWTPLRATLDEHEFRPRVMDLLVLPYHRLLAATPRGVILSRDQGRTWSQPAEGRIGEVLDLASPVSNPEVIVAATKSGFFRSEDAGEHWKRVSPALDGVIPWDPLESTCRHASLSIL